MNFKKLFNNQSQEKKVSLVYFAVVILLVFISMSVLLPDFLKVKYDAKINVAAVAKVAGVSDSMEAEQGLGIESGIRKNGIQSIATPVPLKAIYMTSWVAGTPSIRNNIIKLIDETEINAVVIDIKDYTGMIAFKTGDTELDSSPCIENRVKDIESLLKTLKDKNVYVIGRVSVFQDPCFVKQNPEVAVRKSSDGSIWKDHKGLSWVDMGSKEAWDYNIKIARATYALGFDEINFDYVRYPSDGNMKDISFISGSRAKSEVFKSFFEYLDKELRGGRATYGYKDIEVNLADSTSSGSAIDLPIATTTRRVAHATDPAFDEYYKNVSAGTVQDRIITSADLFGMTTTNKDDLGIGQILENALPYVDYVYPMVYPSHYPSGWNGFKNPAANPYEVIKLSMQGAIGKANAIGLNKQKLRPWLQDFNLGATYNADMIRKQIKATYDLGLDGWLMWNASNKYTRF